MSYSLLKIAFKDIGNNTWDTLKYAYQLGISYGETTISDSILLYLKKLNNPKILTLQTKQNQEATYGTDWEWWIGSDNTGWIGYAVQAKKYFTNDDRYHSLSHKVGNDEQWKILQHHASAWDLIPIYAFYNYVLNENFNVGLFNTLSFYSYEDYGITVTPLHNVINSLSTRGGRNFKFIHNKNDTIPLFELIEDSENYLNDLGNYKIFGNIKPKIYKTLPSRLLNYDDSHFVLNSTEKELGTLAKRILVINIGNNDEY